MAKTRRPRQDSLLPQFKDEPRAPGSDGEPLRFDGATYEPELDQVRLTGQTQRVFACMKDGSWRTFAEVGRVTHDPEASISARLRDLRKLRFGGHRVDRRRRTAGLFEYRLVLRRVEPGPV